MFSPLHDSFVKCRIQCRHGTTEPLIESGVSLKELQVRGLGLASAENPIVAVERMRLFEVRAEFVFEELHQHRVVQAILRSLLVGQQLQRTAHSLPIIDLGQAHNQAMYITRRLRDRRIITQSANSLLMARNSSGV